MLFPRPHRRTVLPAGCLGTASLPGHRRPGAPRVVRPTTLAPMRRESGIPFLIVCVLIGLTAGAAVLGFRQAPPANDLVVHNAAGELLLSTKLTAVYTGQPGAEVVLIRYTAPDKVTETLLQGGPTGKPPETKSATGSAYVRDALNPLFSLGNVQNYSKVSPSVYAGAIPVATLVPANEAHEVSGSEHYVVTVAGGYVVKLVDHYAVSTPAGNESGGGTYRFLAINGAKAPSP